MTYSDGFNLRTTNVKFNDVADAIDGALKRNYAGTTTGTSTAYVATPSPAWTSYSDSPVIFFIPHITNTVGSPSVTINVSGLGAIPIKLDGVDLTAGALVAGSPVVLAYNGVNFEALLLKQGLLTDGTNSATGNLNIGGYKLTNVAAATARTDAAQFGQIQDGTYLWLGTTGGTSTAQTASATPAITGYVAGQRFRMNVGTGRQSTGAAPNAHTININGQGAVNIVSNDGLSSSPTRGTWLANSILDLLYDGTNMRIMNNPAGWQDYGITTSNFTGTAPNVISSITSTEVSRYIKIGKIVTWQFGVQFNLSTGGSSILNLTPPVNAGSGISSLNCGFIGSYAADGAAAAIPICYFNTATNLRVYRNFAANTNWTASATSYLRFVISYEAA